MNIIYWSEIVSSLSVLSLFSKGTGISVGSFDGLHLGHRLILKKLVSECYEQNITPCVVSFTRPLPSIKHSQDYLGDVTTLQQRIKIFMELGIEFVILVDFDESFASIPGVDFLNILVDKCNMKFICEGVDFRFGYKGATDVQSIKYFAQNNNLSTYFENPVIYKQGTDEEERISSSYIRKMISKGFFSTVTELLNRPYEIDVSAIQRENNNSVSVDLIKQVLPPCGIYHCKNENNMELRVTVSDSKIICKAPFKILLFN